MTTRINFLSLFPNPSLLDKYIDADKPVNIIDPTSDFTLFLFVCNNILYAQPIQPWINLALKMMNKYTAEELMLGYANRDGITALILVCGVDNEVSHKILSFGPQAANINAVEKDNKMNALMYSCTEDTQDTALELLEKKSSILPSLRNINNNGYTPLMIACEEKLETIALTMLEDFQPIDLNLLQKNNSGDTAADLAMQQQMFSVYQLINEILREQDILDNNIRTLDNDDYEEEYEESETSRIKNWANKDMPEIPNYPEPVIDINEMGIDTIYYDDKIIKEYLDEDKEDNIVISFENKNYLLSKSIINKQWEDAIVFECLQGNMNKNYPNVVHNLPLFNIKMIGIDIPIDKTGIWPEFIYLDGFESLLQSNEQLYKVIPLVNDMLVSVISLHEVKKIGTGEGSDYGALHCQSGQGGMAGIIVPAKASVVGGKGISKCKTRKRIKNLKSMKKYKGKGKRQSKTKGNSKGKGIRKTKRNKNL